MRTTSKIALVVAGLAYPWVVTAAMNRLLVATPPEREPAPPSVPPESANPAHSVAALPTAPAPSSTQENVELQTALPEKMSASVDPVFVYARSHLPVVSRKLPSFLQVESTLRTSTVPLDQLRVDLYPARHVLLASELKKVHLVVLHFWATWCTPCKAELPYIEALWERHDGRDGIRVLVVAADLDPELARSFAERAKLRFPLYVDPNQFLLDKVTPGTQELPTTVALSPNGAVRFAAIGSLSEDSALTLEREIESARPSADGPPSPTTTQRADAGARTAPHSTASPTGTDGPPPAGSR